MAKETFTVRLPKSEKTALTKEARARHLDASDVLRELLRDGRKFRKLAEVVPQSQWMALLASIES